MRKKSVLGILAVVITVLLVFMAVQGRARFPMVDRALFAVLAPLNNGLTAVGDSFNGVRNFWGALTTMQEENVSLKAEVDALRQANIKMAEIWAENQRLSELLQYKNEAKNLTLQTVKVIGRNFGEAKDTILVNRGSNSGLSDNMPVVNLHGLVGIIDEVYPDSARVLLLSSPRCKVGGIVLRADSRVAGVVSGIVGGDSLMVMSNMARDAEIVSGDIIVTSGFGGNHPSGVVIGTVEDVSLNIGGLLKQAKIVPTVDFNNLEEVMVVTDYNRAYNPLSTEKATGKAGDQ